MYWELRGVNEPIIVVEYFHIDNINIRTLGFHRKKFNKIKKNVKIKR